MSTPGIISEVMADGGQAPPLDRVPPVNPLLACSSARRYNRFVSAAVVLGMVVLGVAIGAVVSLAAAAHGGSAHNAESALPPTVYGAAVGLVLASIAALWGWFGGAAAITKMNGALRLGRDDDAELFEIVHEVALRAGIPAPRLYTINDSALNSCSTGRDPRHASIAITTGLRTGLSKAELRAVIAHEVAHIRRLDTRFALVMATMVGLIALACGWLWRLAFQAGRAAKRSTDTIKAWGWVSISCFVLAAVMTIGAFLIGAFLQFCIRREREYLADADAAGLTGDPEALISALRKLAADTDPLVDVANRATAHLFIVNPLRRMHDSGQSIDSPFCSHPPLAKRIARLEKLARHARSAVAEPVLQPTTT